MPVKDFTLPLLKQYFDEDPIKAARNLEALPIEKAAKLTALLSPTTISKIFPKLQPQFAAKLFPLIPAAEMSHIFQKLSPDFGSALFLSLSKENQQNFLSALPDTLKSDMQEVLTYPDDSVGRIMSREFFALRGDLTARDAIQKIRALSKRDNQVFYVYVINNEGVLIGVLNMRDLMLASSETTIDRVMRPDPISFGPFLEVEKAIQQMTEKKYLAVPVIDAQGKLLGVLRAVNMMREVQEEAAEDIQKMFGVGENENVNSSVWFSLKKRLPWLHVNLGTAFLAAAVVGVFEDIIAKITILAVFLPVVAGQGGNAGAQSLAVVMRGLVMREIPPQRVKGLVFKETVVGLINGVVIGIVTGLISWAWHGSPYLGIVIGLGMLVNLAVAGFSGAAIPLTMKALRIDPAQSSSIILTTVTDVIGFFAFLGFAVLFQRFLI